MRTAAISRQPALAESLLRYYVTDMRSPSCFAACLYTCYDLLRSDVVMELAWRHKMDDFARPYFIQVERERADKLEKLYAHAFPPPKATQAAEDEESFEAGSMLGQTLMITGPGGMGGMGGMPPGMMPPAGMFGGGNGGFQ